MDFQDLRTDYGKSRLDEDSVSPDPVEQFERWFGDALAANIPDANAMTLATADATGAPSARIVLLRGVEGGEFVFFTNYEGRKARELAANPRAALLFFWQPLERQVRVEGTVGRVSPARSDAYFATRPRGSRVAAWASDQSAVVENRAALEALFRECEAKFAGVDPPRPPFWGGYALRPRAFEFWQGGRDRLHDRIAYVREPGAGAAEAEGTWRRERLAP